MLDPQGAAVPGASVSARQMDTNVTIEATTDATAGSAFRICRIGPTTCGRACRASERPRTLVLSAGSAFDLPITLAVPASTPRVTVVAATPGPRDRAQPDRGTVPQAEIQNLPMNGRNFLDLALLIPGVSPTNTNSTQLFAETSAIPGQGLSVASQRNLSNGFIVDGLSANDDAAGLSGIPFGVDAIEQFQVVTGGGQAELGRALGGYVNVVTQERHQRAAWHGLRLLPRRRLQRPQRTDRDALPMDQQQFGGQRRRSARPQPHVLLRERRAQAPRSDRLSASRRDHRAGHQRAAGAGRLSGPAGRRPGSIPIPCTA